MLCPVEDSFPKQVEARAAIHLSFDHFEPINLTFGLAVAPGLSEGRSHGGVVLPETCGEGIESLDLRPGAGIEP